MKMMSLPGPHADHDHAPGHEPHHYNLSICIEVHTDVALARGPDGPPPAPLVQWCLDGRRSAHHRNNPRRRARAVIGWFAHRLSQGVSLAALGLAVASGGQLAVDHGRLRSGLGRRLPTPADAVRAPAAGSPPRSPASAGVTPAGSAPAEPGRPPGSPAGRPAPRPG